MCKLLQFQVAKENKSNEGTCVGVCRLPVTDYGHRSTSDMWLYRAYSGNLYHGGEQPRSLAAFTQGDIITCTLDMDSRTLSFGKNGEVGGIAQKLYNLPFMYLFIECHVCKNISLITVLNVLWLL